MKYLMLYFPISETLYGPNLALHRPTYHTGDLTDIKYSSSTAVDGSPWAAITVPQYCSSYTATSQSHFFRVDLDKIYPISHMEITLSTAGNHPIMDE